MPTMDNPSHSQVHEIIRLRNSQGVGLYQGGVKGGVIFVVTFLRFDGVAVEDRDNGAGEAGSK